MSRLHVRHVKTTLRNAFENKIDLSDVKREEEKENAFLTRSLAAYALVMVANANPDLAAKAVVDGFNDNGIDAIFIDESKQKLFVVQSKLVHNGQNSPAKGDVLSFIKGFNNLMDGDSSNFNEKIKAKFSQIETALDTPGYTYELILIYTGSQKISVDVDDSLKELEKDYNQVSDIVRTNVIDLGTIHRAIAYSNGGKPIDLDISILDYGKIMLPHFAIYGRISAEEIAMWYENYGDDLFAKNLRRYKGDSELNQAIQKSIAATPENFWYFNNGVTILCNKINQKGKGSGSKELGHFYCEGISVINGAQTVGNIHYAQKNGAAVNEASVLVRFISLENSDDVLEFSREVTKATNSQNRIVNKDFAALDEVQERLFIELKIEGIKYAYKTGDKLDEGEQGFTIDDSTIALACANEDVGLSTIAKSNVGKLWEDIDKSPYILLFNSGTTSVRVSRCVEIMMIVEGLLRQRKQEGDLLDGKIATHGNRFILHCIFQKLRLNQFNDPQLDFEGVKQEAHDVFTVIFNEVKQGIADHYDGAYLHSLFKNKTKCAHLKEKIASLTTA
ncbi:TPA: AIPR family protein [Bacillus toyonensis]|nr:AIPR family protein [Bacillus toyonensis]